MKVSKLQVLNLKGVKAFACERFGKFNVISGRNGTGKSTILFAMREAIVSSGVDPSLVRLDEERAEITVQLDHNITITRQITATTNTVKVVKDGQPVSSPQAFLKGILSANQLNPVDFFQSNAKERRRLLLLALFFTVSREVLEKILGDDLPLVNLDKYDFSVHGVELLENIRSDVYDARREQGVKVDMLAKSISQDIKDLPDVVDMKKLEGFNYENRYAELSAAKRLIAENDADLARLEEKRQARKKAIEKEEEITRQIKALQEALVVAQKDSAAILEEGKALKAKTDAFETPDVEAMEADLRWYRSQELAKFKLDEIERKKQESALEQQLHEHMDNLVKRLTNEIPRTCLSQVKLPIDGLTFKGDDILVNGVSIDKLSTSEQIVFAVRLARALAGDLKVICIDRFESLDPGVQDAFFDEAVDDDFEYFFTEVTGDDLTLKTESQAPKVEAPKQAPKATKGAKKAAQADGTLGF